MWAWRRECSASTIRSYRCRDRADGSTVVLLLIDADASSLPTILQRLEVAALEAVPWSAGGACYRKPPRRPRHCSRRRLR